MATYSFSALTDGQAITFDVNNDDLVFDQSTIAAADLRFTQQDGGTRVEVVSGAQAGKDIFLSNVSPQQLAHVNVQFASATNIYFGDNAVAQADDGNNTLIGGAGADLVYGFGGNDFLQGGGGADSVAGGAGNDTISGNDGNDRVGGDAGNDTVAGGGGQDAYVFAHAGAANADAVSDFGSGWDRVVFDAGGFAGLGATGRLVSNDDRFHAAAGATGGADAEDRFVYNTSTRQLFYDADGNGAQAAQLVATLQSGANLVATDIWVEGPYTPPPPPPPSGGTNGTEGDDSITGTSGNDTINGLGGNDTLDGADGADRLDGGAGNDSLRGGSWDFEGGDGADTLIGGDGNDTLDGDSSGFGDGDPFAEVLDGGAGDDFYIVDNPADVLSDASGIDTVRAINMSYTLAAGFENLEINNGQIESRVVGTGNAGANLLDGTNSWHVDLHGMAGNDTVLGGVQNDLLTGGDGDDLLNGEWDFDTLQGGAGNDTLDGGNDDGGNTLTGGAGADTFVIGSQMSPQATNFITDFASGTDKIRLDGSLFADIGPSGNFAAGDARFHAAAGATSGHDADDRVIFDTSTGNVYYDDDGSGGGSAQLIARLPNLAATDIVVINGGPMGGTTSGTEGNDTLTGTTGNDTINGLGGNDWIDARQGNDRVDGGSGDDTVSGDRGADTVIGGAGNDVISGGTDDGVSDTLLGGVGNDLYFVGAGDVTSPDEGGIDQVSAFGIGWTLGDTFEHLVLEGNTGPAAIGTGNALDNRLSNHRDVGGELHGLGGNDTLWSTVGDDLLTGGDGNDSLDSQNGEDTLQGGTGADTLLGGWDSDQFSGGAGADLFVFNANPGTGGVDAVSDFASGVDTLQLDGRFFSNVGASGDFSPSDGRFFAGAGATSGQDADDRVIFNTSTGQLFYDADGSGGAAGILFATLQPGASAVASDFSVINGAAPIEGSDGNDTLRGTSGPDVLRGFAGHDVLYGLSGNDVLEGGSEVDRLDGGFHDDTLSGGSGEDTFVFWDGSANPGNDFIDGGAQHDTLDYVFMQSGVTVDLAAGTSRGGGIGGVGSAIVRNVESVYGTSFADHIALGDNFESVGLVPTANGGQGNDFLSGALGMQNFNGGTGNDTLSGGEGRDFLAGDEGDDLILGGAGDDHISAYSAPTGNDTIDGGTGRDYLTFLGLTAGVVIDLGAGTVTGGGGTKTLISVEDATGGEGNDAITGSAESNFLYGYGGNDTLSGLAGNDYLAGLDGDDRLNGGTGFDTLDGGAGADSYVLAESPSAGSGEWIWFGTGDEIRLDGTAFANIGATGDFAAGDARFWSAAGASAAHDADDRVIYDPSTGRLWYDADGIGGAGAQLFATLASGSVTATDFAVDNGTATPPTGGTQNGTAGNDSLVGGDGHDTLNGFAGNDTLRGNGGNDSLDGGSGTDSLDGGLGDDIYVVTAGDVLVDAGGIDMIHTPVNWTLAAGFENAIATGTAAVALNGNNADNHFSGNAANNYFNARAGNDTILGMGGNDQIDMSTGGTSSPGQDVVDGGAGTDTVDYAGYARSGVTANLATGVVTGGGDGGVGGATLTSIERFVGGGFNDSITGASVGEYLDGREGNDTIRGAGGNDTLLGGTGNDSLAGGLGVDSIGGGTGNDFFVFAEAAGAANADRLTDFASGADELLFDNAVMAGLGANGAFVSGDDRFHAAAGASGGADAEDRLVYNTSTGQLYYDADGSGSGASQLVATLNAGAALAATDITVI